MLVLAVELPNWTTIIASASAALVVALTNIFYQAYSHRRRVRFETRFQTMHEKQAEAIQTLYAKIEATRDKLFTLVSSTPAGDSHADAAFRDAYGQCSSYFQQHQLLFPLSVAGPIADILLLMCMVRGAGPSESEAKGEQGSESVQLQMDLRKKISELRDTFRTMMSVEDEK